MTRISRAESKSSIDSTRELFREYADSLGFNLCFQDFDNELASLPGEYSPPYGCILLARVDGRIAGCVALRKIEDNICEMKRLYVRSPFRGRKIGHKLASRIIREAERLGYKTMRLDTVPQMKEAVALYRSFGFTQIHPYRHNPIPGAMFFEMSLKQPTNRGRSISKKRQVESSEPECRG